MRSPRLILLASLALSGTVGCLAGDADLLEIPDGFDPEGPGQQCRGKCDGGGETPRLAALPNATVATRFAPYETPLAFDLTLIDAVVEARRADPAAYDEGANPHAIRYAVYNLRNAEIAAALADAADAGVDVQVLIEADQLDPARDWNVTDEMLIARGFEYAPDHRALDAEGRRTADLVGVTGSGLMHLKARVYRWRDSQGLDQRRLVTGSMNPGDHAVDNDETLHYVDDAVVLDAFEAKYAAVLAGTRITNVWRDGAAVNVLFSPDGGAQARDHIARLIDDEAELVVLAMYSLRNLAPSGGGAGILTRLAAARQRGVTVVVITDRKQSDGIDADGNPIYWNDGSEEILRDAGIPVYEVINQHSPFNAMHTKYAVFGLTRPMVVTDAGNWTKAGLGSGGSRPSNDESVLFIDSMALDGGATAQRYLGNFLDIVHRYGGDPATGGPAPAALVEELFGLPAWPAVAVDVDAIATTLWGQSVYLTGALPELGDWTRGDELGWRLETDGVTYPHWRGSLALPFGERSAYKLIKSSGSSIEWETGADRWLVADPTDLRMAGRDGRVALDLSWR